MRMVSEVVEIIEKKNDGFGSYAAGSLSLDCWMESDVHFNICRACWREETDAETDGVHVLIPSLDGFAINES